MAIDFIPDPEPARPLAPNTPRGPRAIVDLINREADRQGVPRELAHAVAKMESAYNPGARSPVGAAGIMQLMPGTARDLGVKNRFDPVENVRGGMKYLAQLSKQYGGNPRLVLAGYNAGPGAVNRYGGVPPFRETRNYVAKGIRLITQGRPPAQSSLIEREQVATEAPVAVPQALVAPDSVSPSINPYEELPPKAAPALSAGIPDVRSTITYESEQPTVDFIAYEPAPAAATPAASAQASGPGGAPEFLKGLIVNPVKGAIETARRIAAGPESTGQLAGEIAQSHVDTARKAADAWQKGDRSEAVGYALASVIPILGPAAAGVGEKIGEGKIAEGLGETAALIATMPTPARAISRPVAAGARVAGRAAATGATAAGGAIKGAVKSVPAAAGGALEGAFYGAMGGPGGAAIGAKIGAARVLRKGAMRGAREALAARREALAAKVAAAAEAARPRPVPETIITPAPPAAAEVIPINRRLPAGREPIITPPPEVPPDTSFVRTVPAQLPEVVPENLRTSPAAEELAQRMRTEMEASGTLQRGEALPATTEAELPKPSYQDLARAAKSESWADVLERYVEANDVKLIEPAQWKQIADAHGLKVPSETTRAEIEFKLRKRAQAKRRKPRRPQ